jgi:hypothetical protein
MTFKKFIFRLIGKSMAKRLAIKTTAKIDGAIAEVAYKMALDLWNNEHPTSPKMSEVKDYRLTPVASFRGL